jgi:molecular chaperone GrpE
MTGQPERDVPAHPTDGGAEDVDEQANGAATPSFGAERAGSVGAAAAEILTDVFALTKERDEYLSALQRSQADFANYRKRVLRQQEEQASRGALDLVGKILPVLDTLDLVVAHLASENGEPSTEAQALRQARGQLLDTLVKEGLERVDQVGVPFDPSVHDAVAHAPREEDGEHEEGDAATIDEVMRSGYRWRGHTLRPAMVRVRG